MLLLHLLGCLDHLAGHLLSYGGSLPPTAKSHTVSLARTAPASRPKKARPAVLRTRYRIAAGSATSEEEGSARGPLLSASR